MPSERPHAFGPESLPIELDRDGAVILAGDSVELLPRLHGELVDALVSDPPYGLEFNGNDWDGKTGFAESLPGVDVAGMSDGEVFEEWCAAWARGALHALKPGAHLAAFGGTRTWHRMVRGIENAGFEVRDQIAWIYSSGMPKSMDLGYALDKRNGIRRPDRIVQQSEHDGVLGATRRVVQHGTAVSEDAQRWEGWGTGLRPSFEPIIIARKPMVGTVVDNVRTHGTGAIHIDAARFGEAKWPANVVLDPSQADAMDLLTGTWRTDPVSARFPIFRYEQKAPESERPRAFGVSHATVKPLSLMRWLIRLLTPPGGLVLEPFAGSGSTVEAALLEGMRVVAIEKDPTFLPLIASRVDRVTLGRGEHAS
jgi:site-specific DNA-methyltransferase (adenine-specific)